MLVLCNYKQTKTKDKKKPKKQKKTNKTEKSGKHKQDHHPSTLLITSMYFFFYVKQSFLSNKRKLGLVAEVKKDI